MPSASLSEVSVALEPYSQDANAAVHEECACGDPHAVRTTTHSRVLNRLLPSVPFVVSTVLLAAATLKTFHTIRFGGMVRGGQFSPLFAVVLVSAEVGAAALLLSGIARRVMCRAAGAMLALFGVYAAYSALSGATSCGCFGDVAVNPWLTTICDGLMALGLWRCANVGPPTVTPRARNRGLTATVILYGMALVLASVVHLYDAGVDPAVHGDRAVIIETSSAYIVDPSDWMGRQLPSHHAARWPETIGVGEVDVLFYHHDCQDCRRYLAGLSEAVSRGLFLVSVPPHSPGDDPGLASKCPMVRLDESRTWFVRTPLLLRLQDGVVTEVKTADQLRAEMERQAKP